MRALRAFSTPAEVGVHVPAKRCGQACGSAVDKPVIGDKRRRTVVSHSSSVAKICGSSR